MPGWALRPRLRTAKILLAELQTIACKTNPNPAKNKNKTQNQTKNTKKIFLKGVGCVGWGRTTGPHLHMSLDIYDRG